jgi:hypothetical protein
VLRIRPDRIGDNVSHAAALNEDNKKATTKNLIRLQQVEAMLEFPVMKPSIVGAITAIITPIMPPIIIPIP